MSYEVEFGCPTVAAGRRCCYVRLAAAAGPCELLFVSVAGRLFDQVVVVAVMRCCAVLG